jgi:hypothetical protein
MMIVRRLLLLCGLFAAACAQQPEATVIPTLPPVIVEPAVEDAHSAPTATEIIRATLPPTWTPEPLPSATPTTAPVPTIDVTTEFMMAQPTLPACAAFDIDRERSAEAFTLGTSPLVAWQAVLAAVTYRVTLYDGDFNVLQEQDVPTTQHVFSPDLFRYDDFYFWEVRPLDRFGVQICLPRGGRLVPQL